MKAAQRSCAGSPTDISEFAQEHATDGAVVTTSALGCPWGWAEPVHDPNAEIYSALIAEKERT